MRVLEARFHRDARASADFVVVGHVVWERDRADERPVVQPSARLVADGSPATMLAKLQYLVASAASFERLQGLKSQFWTFVEVPPKGSGA